jgi:hypothetical protein
MVLRATQKLHGFEFLPFQRFASDTRERSPSDFDDTDFAGAEAGSIRGNCSKRILPLRRSRSRGWISREQRS